MHDHVSIDPKSPHYLPKDKTKNIEGGGVVKGGHNRPVSQIINRPPPPTPTKPQSVDELRDIIRAEVQRIAKKIVKQALAEMISSGVLFQNPTATAHPKYQPHPKRPHA